MTTLSDQIVAAGDLNINLLYHYQPFDLDRVSPIILSNRLYFSKPYDFNDPWDCRPAFDVEGLLDEPTREQTIEYIQDLTRKRGDDEGKVADYGARLRADPEYLRAQVVAMNGLADAINEKYRIYSLALHGDVALMWSHYGRGHTGICLEFNVEYKFMGSAQQVQYSQWYPTIPLAAKGNEVLLPVMVKSADWQYEVEYRLIAVKGPLNPKAPDLIRTDEHWVDTPAGTLKSVIVGCQMPKVEREKVRALVAQAAGNVELKEAVKIADRYALRIEPLSEP
jgi:hypothetical protein